MINFATIETALVAWVMTQATSSEGALPSGQVIWEDQSEQRPDGEYASLKFINGPQRIGHDVLLNATPDFTISGLRELVLSVNLYRVNAFQRAFALHSSIQDPLVLEAFQAAGLFYVSETAVRNLTRPVGPRFENRFQFDVRFRLADNIATNPGVIEEVGIDGEVSGSTGPDLDITINVTKP